MAAEMITSMLKNICRDIRRELIDSEMLRER
jgi:hypothetical protein